MRIALNEPRTPRLHVLSKGRLPRLSLLLGDGAFLDPTSVQRKARSKRERVLEY